MDRRALTKLADDLRMAGVEAVVAPWGASGTWTSIQVGRVKLLWTGDGEYDGWVTVVEDTPEDEEEVGRMMREAVEQRKRRGFGGTTYEGEEDGHV